MNRLLSIYYAFEFVINLILLVFATSIDTVFSIKLSDSNNDDKGERESINKAEYNEWCDYGSQCFNNVECIENHCQCITGLVYKSGANICVALAEYLCQTNIDCENIDINRSCINSTCQCSKGFIDIDYVCVAKNIQYNIVTLTSTAIPNTTWNVVSTPNVSTSFWITFGLPVISVFAFIIFCSLVYRKLDNLRIDSQISARISSGGHRSVSQTLNPSQPAVISSSFEEIIPPNRAHELRRLPSAPPAYDNLAFEPPPSYESIDKDTIVT